MEMTNRKEKLEWRTYRKEFQFRCQIGEEHYFRCQIENFLKKIRQGSNLQALEFMINKQHFFYFTKRHHITHKFLKVARVKYRQDLVAAVPLLKSIV
jgi:hypothetical protein